MFTAAHNTNGNAALIIKIGTDGSVELYSSVYALEETFRNLQRKYPDSVKDLAKFQSVLSLSSHRVGLPQLSGLAEKDQPIFQAALNCNATHLLTGDIRDFGRFMNRPADTYGICIQTVTEFINVSDEVRRWRGRSHPTPH